MFGRKSKRRTIDDILLDLTNGLGPYVPDPSRQLYQQRQTMLNDIESIEPTIVRGSNAEQLFRLGVSYSMYCGWYLRGDDRKPALHKATTHLQAAVDRSEHPRAASELARILIDEKVVRDLDRALILCDRLEATNQLPEWMDSLVSKAKRWVGQYEPPKDSNFCGLSPTPAVLQEERTLLRKVLVDQMKNQSDQASTTARRLYNLGLLAAFLYGDLSASSGVSGMKFQAAQKRFPKICDKFDFDYLGRIEGADFLTSTDYKRIEKILGNTPTVVNVKDVPGLIA